MHILFSMPVHENNDIVRMSLKNIEKYVKKYTVVIHVSQMFVDFDESIGELPNVIVNPVRNFTRHGSNQLGIHLDNFRLAVVNNVPFTTFCVFHTSEMFVRTGVESVISQHDYSIWFNPETMPQNATPGGQQWANILRIGFFDDLLPSKKYYLASIIEGTWISREIMYSIYNYIIQKPDLMNSQMPWVLEEMALPTLAHWFGQDRSYGEPYNAFFDKPLEISDIDQVIKCEPVELWPTNCWNTSGIPVLSRGETKFSVKRFNRSVDDVCRQYVLGLS